MKTTVKFRQTPAIVPTLGVMYFYSAHTQWTPEAKPPENSPDTTAGDCSVDARAVWSFQSYQRQHLLDDLYVHLRSQLPDKKLPKVQLFHTTSYSY